MRRKIQKFIEDSINPSVSAHGGMIELIDVMNNTVYIRMGGGCQGCGMASVTLRHGVERMIIDEFPSIEKIVDQTDHNAGNNPYSMSTDTASFQPSLSFKSPLCFATSFFIALYAAS